MDIETQDIVSFFPLQSYKKGSTLACDSEYIYINFQAAESEAIKESILMGSDGSNISEKDFMRIDIYSYEGKLIKSIDLSETVKNSLCARYLYSTDKYIFIGEAGVPLCRELYVLEKSALKQEADVPITELYVYTE